MFSITSGCDCSLIFLVSFVNGIKSSFEWSYLFLPFLSSSSNILPPKLIFICSPKLSSSNGSTIFSSFSNCLAFFLFSISSCLAFCCSSFICCFLSYFSSLCTFVFSTKSFIISDIFIPNVNTASIITTPIHNIIAPTGLNKLASGVASIAPNAPPPLSCIPKLYASFTTVDKLLSEMIISPEFISHALIKTAMLINNTAYCVNFDVRYSSSSNASFIPTANVPIGKMYFIIPIIPPKISFNFIPTIPDFPYIRTHNNILNIIKATTAKSVLDALFLALVFFLFLLFLFAIFIPPKVFFHLKSVLLSTCPIWDVYYWDTFCPSGHYFNSFLLF